MALAALSGDEQRIIFSRLCNVLDPGVAVAFSSASSELWALTHALRQQLSKTASEAEAARLAHELEVHRRQEQAMRRMLQLPLARALSSWREMVRQRQVLRNAALGLHARRARRVAPAARKQHIVRRAATEEMESESPGLR